VRILSREEKLRTIISTIDNSEYSATKKTTNNKCMMKTFKEANDTWLAEAYSKKKYADYKPFQFVDGEGVRCSIYLSGCLFACKECFNESIQNFNAGQLYTKEIEDQIEEEMSNFLEFIRSKKTDCVFVTNEIGSGLVPDYPLGRHFRDICGRINQLVAKNSDEAYLAISGIKLKIK